MRKTFFTLLILGLPLAAQKTDDGTIGFGIQDYHQARTSPFQTGTSLPGTCSPTTHEFFYKTDTHVLYECTGTNTWTAVPVGFTDHALLTHLGRAASGHTLTGSDGFASAVHASAHLAAGADPLTSLTATPNGVPQAASTGLLDPQWLTNMVGATGSSGGTKGAVPAPSSSDVNNCLKGNGTWGNCGGLDLLTYLTSKGSLLTSDGASLIGQDPGTAGQVVAYDTSSDTGLKAATLIFNNDWDLVLASSQAGTAKASDQLSWVSGNAPTAAVGSGTSQHAWAGLDFPDSALTCIEIQTVVPNSWSGGQVDFRVKWVNMSGHFGVNSGGVCIPDSGHSNEQQCMKLTVQTAFFPDGTNIVAPALNSAKLSDVMPARGGSLEYTGAIRGIDMTGAAQRNTMRAILCRDSRVTNSACNESTPATTTCDGIVGTVRLTHAIINWPTSIQVQ